MNTPLRVLIVEDSEDDTILLVEGLRRGGYGPTFERVDTPAAMTAALKTPVYGGSGGQTWDIVISDYSMPHFSGFAALKLLKESGFDLPFIILSGAIGEETAVEVMRAGAHDYIMKDNLARLIPAIERELREAEVRREHRRAEEELQESKRRLEETLAELKATQQQIIQQERLHALGQMASGIAHDFNNTMMPILGYSEMMLMFPQTLADSEKATSYLELINTAAKDAKKIVSRLREFYRPRGEDEIFMPINLNQLVKQVIELTKPKWKEQAQASGITINVEADLQKIPYIMGSEVELREVVTNVIFNAVDAMPKSGTITISTRCDGKHVVFEVSDTGGGMTEEFKQRCFEPFFSTKGGCGTGLGLAIVYGIIQRHEGKIEIESAPDKGTTFIIRLPFQMEEQTKAKSQEAEANLRSLRVLVVDDMQMTRELVTEYLTADGHTVEIATNGVEGLEKFHVGKFDLVITDQSMPDMNGTQFATLIKQIAPNKPIILLTGFGDMMETSGEKQTCIDFLVSKPVTITTFREVLAKVSENF